MEVGGQVFNRCLGQESVCTDQQQGWMGDSLQTTDIVMMRSGSSEPPVSLEQRETGENWRSVRGQMGPTHDQAGNEAESPAGT